MGAAGVKTRLETSSLARSRYGTSDQFLRLRRDDGPGGGMTPLSGKKLYFRGFWVMGGIYSVGKGGLRREYLGEEKLGEGECVTGGVTRVLRRVRS